MKIFTLVKVKLNLQKAYHKNYSRKSKIAITTENYSCKSKIKLHWQKHIEKKITFAKVIYKIIAQRKCIGGKHTPKYSFITLIRSRVDGKTLVLGFF